MASVRSELQSLMKRGKSVRDIEEPWWMPEYRTGKRLSGLAESIKGAKRVNMLPQLAGLIRDEGDLTNYENMSKELTKKAGRHTETAPYAPYISSVADNIREDYNMYTTSMESGAKLIDNPDFITDMQGWDDLENTVAKMTLEDGKTPKYSGNGTLLFLTEQNDNINSIIGRIQNSSKGRQFKYNKAGNKYTDAEMIKKLEEYQGRLGVALEASLGDGIITKEEAESIMLGDLSAYQKRKSTALKRIDSHYNKLDKLQQTLKNKYDSVVLKNEGFDFSDMISGLNLDLSTIQTQVELDEDGQPIEGAEFIDTDISATSKQDILTQLEDRIGTIHGVKGQYKKSHTGWSGAPFRPKVTVSKKEQEELLKNISIKGDDPSVLSTEITGVTDQDKGEIDVATIDLDAEKEKVSVPPVPLDDYVKAVGTPDFGKPSVGNLQFFKDLEKNLEDLKLKEPGTYKGKGGKKLERMVASYQKELDRFMKRWDQIKTGKTKERWDDMTGKALNYWLKNRGGQKQLDLIYDMINSMDERDSSKKKDNKSIDRKDLYQMYKSSPYMQSLDVDFQEIESEWIREGAPDAGDFLIEMFPDIEPEIIR